MKPRRLGAGAFALALAGVLVAIGCASRLALRDIAFVAHRGVVPVLDKRKHATRGLTCLDCHDGARTRPDAGMPDRAFCMVCHEVIAEHEAALAPGGELFDDEGRAKWEVRSAVPEGVTFSHATHAASQTCEECHGDIEGGEFGLVDLAGTYENCRRCHTQDALEGECRLCHISIAADRRPHSHDAAWATAHGWQVRSGGMSRIDSGCTQCHNESYCVKCHSEERPANHTVFWSRAGHSLAASIDRERCAACHTEDRCIRCHMSAPVLPGWHPTGKCDSCHTGLDAHVFATDNCSFCHR